jgi:demethylmenaquinone methyltransferase / 2-methoxy-6-polyprenyl-1,4-benzoquinol methylase
MDPRLRGDDDGRESEAVTETPDFPEPEDTADFGFRRVHPAAKPGLVRDVFESVASRYDLMNDLMSGGIHRLWKQEFIDRLAPRAGERILDVAGGTGDIAAGIVQRRGAEGSVIVCDLTQAMLEAGRDRMIDAGLLHGIDWVRGDAEHLPIKSSSMDAYTIAFGLRNVPRIEVALAEALRVLKRGGRFLCLEFSKVDVPGLDRLYEAYSFTAIPAIGEVVAGDGAPYRYLVESIRKFPDADTLAGMIGDAGFHRASFTRLTGGVVAIHSGWKL